MKTRQLNRAEAQNRLRHAEDFLVQGDHTQELQDQAVNAAVSSFVLAGISAADVICALTFGYCSAEHRDAVKLVKQVTGGHTLAAQLQVLINLKTKAQYTAAVVSTKDTKRARRAATDLVAEANRRFRRG